MNIEITAVQNRAVPFDVPGNLDHARELLEKRGPAPGGLVVFPELFSAGYVANVRIAELGETEEGPTLGWMRDMARKYAIFLGGGVAVYEKGDLYNRYYLIGPDGKSLGHGQKEKGEAFCFKGGQGIHLINSPLGRIAVLICADSHFSGLLEEIRRAGADILLLPHAWPSGKDITAELKSFARLVHSLTGLPVVFANLLGPMERMQGIMGSLMARGDFALRGNSVIIDGEGETAAEPAEMPGTATRIITVGEEAGKKVGALPPMPSFQGMIHPGSPFLRRIIIPLDILRGNRVYDRRVRKKVKGN